MPEPPQRILLIRPSALGDVCRSVPVLVSLRRAYPHARIDWLVQADFAPAVAHHPALSGIVPFDRRGLARQLRRARPGPALRFLRGLRRGGYDVAIDCQGLARSALFTYATRAPLRIGDANAREMGRIAYNRARRVPAALHTVDRMLALARLAGAEPIPDMRLYADRGEREWVRAHPDLADGFILIAPTSRWPAKQWPPERFAAVAGRLASRGQTIVLVGGPSERSQVAPLLELARREPRIIDLIGDTTIARLMALVEAARLVIANDSAALHMAAGFGRPLIGLFGPTRIELVGPYGRAGDVIQHITPADRPDHKDKAAGRALMERISVEEVLAKVGERIGVSP